MTAAADDLQPTVEFFARRFVAVAAELDATRARLAAAEAALAAVREACFRDGYTTWDQDEHLGEPPWKEGPALAAWEAAHGHDPRLKCYPEFGCQLLIDPEDVLAVVAGVSRVTPQDQKLNEETNHAG